MLAERDFVHPVAPSFPGDAAFRFKHLLVREAVYHATAKRLRATLHEAFADWLEQVAGDRINEFEEILAYHLEQAFRFLSELGPIEEAERKLAERAAAHLVTAARRAAALSDFEAVASMIRRALALGVADPRERVRVRFELGHALHQTRHVAEAEEVLTDTHDVAVQLGVDDVAALALVQLAWNRTGDPSGVYNHARRLEISEQAIEVLTRAGDQRGLALARRLRGVTLNYTDVTASGLELEQALRHARASGDKEMIRLTIGSIANAYLCDGPTPASIAIERCEDLLDSVRGDRVLEATVKRPLALFYAMSLRPADALRLVGEASDVLDELELRTRRSTVGWASTRSSWPGTSTLPSVTRGRSGPTSATSGPTSSIPGPATRSSSSLACTATRAAGGRRPRRWRTPTAWVATYSAPRRSAREIAVEARLAAHRGNPDAVPQAEEAVERSERRMGDLTSRAIVSLALAEVERSAGFARQANASLERAVALFKLKGNIAAAAAIERRWGPGRQTLPAAE